MAAGFHSLGHGDTRTGKTNWIDGLLVQLHHKASYFPVRILAGDFKRELAATWQRSRLIDSVETDPAAIAEIIDEIVNGADGILERYDLFGRAADERGAIIRSLGDYRKTTGDTSMGVTFLVVDELNAVLEAAGKKSRLSSSLKQALQTGAGAGVFILGGAQYLTAALFGRDGSKQFVTRAHFGREDGHALRMMFGQAIDDQARELLTGQPGRGLIRTVQQQQALPFQALRCTDDDILGVLQLTDDAPTMERATPAPAAPDQEPRTASAPRAPACDNGLFSVDFAEQVRRCKQQGMSKTATITLLTGIKRGGGSERYKAASAAYDQAIKDEQAKVVGE
jgi:DNA segregation ATPase FtsK/SpoIIIE-like protein